MKYQFFFPNKVNKLIVVNKLGSIDINGIKYQKGIHRIEVTEDNIVTLETDKVMNNCDVCGMTANDKISHHKFKVCI